MTFAWPVLLLALPLVPLGALALWALGRRRAARVAAFGAHGLAPGPAAVGRRAVVRRRLVAASYLVGLMILTLSLGRPTSIVALPVSEGMVILAFDVSRSMAATDLAPTRLEAARTAARAFVERQPQSVVIGVVAFSDSGFAVQSPSNDRATVLAAIDRLTPQTGTSLGQGIQNALNAIALAESDQTRGFYTNRSPQPSPSLAPVPPGTHRSASVVILTDGEDTQSRPDPLQAAQAAADRGIRIYTVGIGSDGGADVQVGDFTVHTALDADLLARVAQLTGGAYFSAQSAGDLQQVYDNIDPRIEFRNQVTELTALVAAAGLVVLLLGALASLAWTGRVP